MVDNPEKPQDPGVVNEVATTKFREKLDNINRMKNNPITVEVLPEFSRLSKQIILNNGNDSSPEPIIDQKQRYEEQMKHVQQLEDQLSKITQEN